MFTVYLAVHLIVYMDTAVNTVDFSAPAIQHPFSQESKVSFSQTHN